MNPTSDIVLVQVKNEPTATHVLYDLMKEATPEQSISHKALPRWEDHMAFVCGHHYRDWWLIQADGRIHTTYKIARSVQFSLPAGTWGIELRMTDAGGNSAVVPLMDTNGQPAGLHTEVPASPTPTAPSPKVYQVNLGTYFAIGILFGLHPADVTVYWQIQARNVPYNPASWKVATKYGSAIGGLYRYGQTVSGKDTTLPPVLRGKNGQTLYAYISEPGHLDSSVIIWNY